jgi:hypothetical protein
MRNVIKMLALVAMFATIAPAALADHHGRDSHRDWNRGNRGHYNHVRTNQYWQNQNWRYNQNYSPNNDYVGPDGYPAWMGGYRPGR